MIDAICVEIELQKHYLESQSIQTIYFGGGTPSVLTSDELSQILNKIKSEFDTSKLIEVTLEANPDDISKDKINDWKTLGVNRLSIGLQSFKSFDLEWMNRAHTVVESMNCVQLAIENGIDNLTVDLMYGLPNLTNDEWISHIETVVSMGVNHVSAYCLTVEEGTALDKFVEKGKVVPASENIQAEQFLILVETLEKYGFVQYEISNFSKPNFESKHNSNYWKGVHYLGIGPSAHSYNGHSRSWNIRNNHQYMSLIESNGIWNETEKLSEKDVFNELILTGLRTIYGVNLAQLAKVIPLTKVFCSQIDQLCDQQLMIKSDDSICLTPLGRLQADRIASDLFQV